MTYTDSALSDAITTFLKSYKRDGRYVYIDKIDQMVPSQTTSITVNYTDFWSESSITDEFEANPDRVLKAFSRAIKETLQIKYPEYAKENADRFRVRITDYPIQKSVREINADTSGMFVTIRAILIRMSAVESIAAEVVYKCPDEHLTKMIAKDNHTIATPVICSNPNCKHRELDIVNSACKFVDYQILQLQELPGELPAGMLPKGLSVFVLGDLVDSARMGDVVEICGIIRPELEKEIKLGVPVQTYRHQMYANNITQLSNDNDYGVEITKDDVHRITAMIKRMDEEAATEMLTNSLAPYIYVDTIIREALILAMIGANSHTLADGKRVRGDINIFLVGDPGTAKSEIGKAVYRVAPRAFYTSGRGSSWVGLTAATIEDNTTGVYMFEPGVMVLADKGLAVIDEFEKMREEERSALHEVMEQQTVSVRTGGIMATLNARTSILAIANPIYGKYDPFKNLTENIPAILIPLLTRFDMIFVVRDIPGKEKDTAIADQIADTHDGVDGGHRNTLDQDDFAKYLRIAKRKHPKLTKEAKEKITEYYIKMRNMEEDGITITPRQFEGLIRVTVARAKMFLKDEVDVIDAERAIHLMGDNMPSCKSLG